MALLRVRRWVEYVADVERAIMSKSVAEQDRIFDAFRALGTVLHGLPDDVGEALYTAILMTLPKLGTSKLEELLPKAQSAAPNLVAAIRSYDERRAG